MKISLKKETYRSEGRGVNMNDDKVRLVIDMNRTDWPRLRKILSQADVEMEDDQDKN